MAALDNNSSECDLATLLIALIALEFIGTLVSLATSAEFSAAAGLSGDNTESGILARRVISPSVNLSSDAPESTMLARRVITPSVTLSSDAPESTMLARRVISPTLSLASS